MIALEKVLGKDVVTLICRYIYAIHISELNAEYHQRVSRAPMRPEGAIAIKWLYDQDPVFVEYNWCYWDRLVKKVMTPIFNKRGHRVCGTSDPPS